MQESKRIPFGDYAPDLSPLVNPGLVEARNTVPIGGGYKGINSILSISDFSGMSEAPRGAIAGITSAGDPYNVVGTQTTLQLLASPTATHTDARWDVSGATYNCQENWEFATFRNRVFATDYNDAMQYYDLDTPPTIQNFQDVPDAPRAKHLGVIGSFLIAGNTFDTTNGADPTAIHWAAIDDPLNWPTPGTEAAVAVQSDRQPLQGDGGAVQRIVQGAEVGAIFQERAIWRADYRGGDVVFQLTRVEPLRGLLVPQIAVPFGRLVFYLAEDGFYLFDYTESVSIGREVIDRTFLSDVNLEYADRISAAVDPNEQRIWVAYPAGSSTTANKYLCFDWGLRRWAHGDQAYEWLTQSVAAGRNLDSAATAADPDDLVGSDSFDDRVAATGSLELGAVINNGGSYELGTFEGAGVAGVLKTGRRELSPGFHSMVSGVHMLVENVRPTVQVGGTKRLRETDIRFSRPQRIDEDGDAYVRLDAKYHTFQFNLPAGFDNASGFDVMFQRSGVR